MKKEKNVFLLAEADKPSMHKDGFDATYTWNEFHMLNKIAKGERPAFAIDSALNHTDTTFPAH
ncbi:hypothetical protein ACSTJV_23905, partial [Vibrio parahaemolyticus]